MQISELKLREFHGFHETDIFFNGKTTILYGVNGAGKSSILHAIDIAFSRVLKKVLQSKKGLPEYDEEDVFHGKNKSMINLSIVLDNDEVVNLIEHYGLGKVRAYDLPASNRVAAFLLGFANDENFMDTHREERGAFPQEQMPIYVSYIAERGTINSADDKPRRYRKIDALEEAVFAGKNFNEFASWYRRMEDIENEAIVLASRRGIDCFEKNPILEAVREAMLAMFPGFSNIRYDRIANTIVVEKSDLSLNMSQLSEGERSTIILFGDIARRLAISNDNESMDPLLGRGIVLIDEIDLHLHPGWQEMIIPKLIKTFPNIQFIVTTHSPKVLSSVGEEVNVIKMISNSDGNDVIQMHSMDGWDVNEILEQFMEVSSLNEKTKQLIEMIHEALQNKEYAKARELTDILQKKTDGKNPEVVRANVLINRGQ